MLKIFGGVALFTMVCAGLGSATAQNGRIDPTPNRNSEQSRAAKRLAQAIAVNPRVVRRARFSTIPPFSDPTAVSTKRLANFPRHGSSFAILSNGDAKLGDNRNTSTFDGVEIGGPSVRGARDVTILRIELRVPSKATCLSFRFRYLSEEFPEFVNSDYNDAFIAELDESTWTAGSKQDPRILAPNNFAVDSKGNRISVNAVGDTSVNARRSRTTTYDGATRILRASTPVTLRRHILYLSIFDQGDRVFDSAVFLDRLTLNRRKPCVSGVLVD